MRSSVSFVVALVALVASCALSPVALGSSGSGSLDADPIIVTQAASNTYSSSSLKWSYCGLAEFGKTYEFDKRVSLECATLNTTACYAVLDGGCSLGNRLTHSLKLTRVRIGDKTPTSPMVWVVHDSLLSKQTAEQVIARFSKQSNATAYTVQSRLFDDRPSPVYPSGLAACGDLAANYSSSLSIDTAVTTAVAKCKTWIENNFGTNGIRAYSIDSAAQDLALAMSAATNSANPMFIYASGRGRLVVSRLMALTTNLTVLGAIYDSPLPSPLAEESVASAMTRFVAACDGDPYCRDKFKGISSTLAAMIKMAYTTVDGSSGSLSKCYELLRSAAYDATRDLKASHGVRRFFMAMRKSSPGGSQAIPPILYRIKRCDKFDIKFLERFFGKTSSQTLVAPLGMSPTAAFVDQVVSFSELWPSLQPRDKLVSTFEASPISDGLLVAREPAYCVFTGSTDAACTELYKDGAQPDSTTPLTYSASKAAGAKYDVLVLASRVSPVGASAGASQVYDTITASKTSDQTVIMVQSDGLYNTEMEGSVGDSLLRLIDAFLTKRARGLNGKWHISDLGSFTMNASQPTTASVASSLDTKTANISFAMSNDESKNWFQQYNPYEGYQIISVRGGERDDPDLVDDGSDIPWEAIVVSIVGGLGLLYIFIVRSKMACSACRPSAPPMYVDTPAPLPIQWSQPPPYQPQQQQHMQPIQPAQWQAPPPPPQWPQPVQPGQWQGIAAETQQNQTLSQRLWERRQSQQQPQPTAPPMWPAPGSQTDVGGDQGELIVQVHRL